MAAIEFPSAQRRALRNKKSEKENLATVQPIITARAAYQAPWPWRHGGHAALGGKHRLCEDIAPVPRSTATVQAKIRATNSKVVWK